jgi:tetratricopeptide (TPR) repeat protein
MELGTKQQEAKSAEQQTNTEEMTKHAEDIIGNALSYYHRQRYKDAKSQFEQAVKVIRAIYPIPHLLLARALGNLANTCKELKDFNGAVKLYEEAIIAFAQTGDKTKQGIILMNAAYTYKLIGKWKDVKRLCEQRLTLGDELKEEVVQKAQDLLNQSMAAIEVKRKAEELKMLQQKLDLAKLLVNRQDDGALLKLAEVYSEAERCKVVQVQANCLVQMARVHYRIGQKDISLEELNRACALHRACKHDINGEHTALGDLAALLISTQRPEQAIAVLQQKVELTTNEQERIELVTRITQMRADANSVNVAVPSQFINSVGGNRSEVELQLQRAELDAKKERELMQLCFKDIPFDDVLKRAEQAQQTLDQLIPLLRTHAEAEDQYGKVLSSGLLQTNVAANFFGGSGLSEKAKFKEPGTLGKALTTIRQDYKISSEQSRALASKMQDVVIDPLTKHKEQLKAATKRLNTLALRSSAALKKAFHTVDQAKTAHKKLNDSEERTRKQLEAVDPNSKDGPKKQINLSKKLSKLVVQREEAKDKIRHVEVQKEMQKSQHSADIMSIADDYQRAELMRIDVVKEHALEIVKLQIEAMEKRQKRLKLIMNTIQSIDSTSDVRLYAHNRNVQNILTRNKNKLGGSKGGSKNSDVICGGSIGRGKRENNDETTNDNDDRFESSHRLLKEIVMGVFADAELKDTNFRKKTIAKDETAESKKLKQDDVSDNCDDGDGEEKKQIEDIPLLAKSIDDIDANMKDYSALFHHESNRTMFVKLLNLQRSKVQDVGIGYHVLSALMCNYLNCCAKQSDVKSAKMIMIMSETFYRNRTVITGGCDKNNKVDEEAAANKRAALKLDGRTDTREYLQTHIRQHEIWHNPHFWEEAFFMSCREEVRKHMKRASELAANEPAEFKRVYVNICFGQLGSYALNMINFGVSIDMTRAFIEKMSDVNNLTKEQKCMLLDNANAVATSAKEAGVSRRGSVVAPKFSDSPKARLASGSISSQTEEVEYM